MKSQFFQSNRKRLAEKVPGSLIVVTAYHELQMLHDQAHPFRQESNFWYLSGIDEPSWRLIIDTKRDKSYAVYPKLSQTKQIFDGELSPEIAKQISGVDQVIDSDEAESLLRQLRREHRLVYMVEEDEHVKKYASFHPNPAHKELKTFLSNRFESVRDAREYLADLRAIKQAEEISALKKAASISAKSFQNIADMLPEFKNEYEIEARLGYDFRHLGGDGHAYHPIVASGANACTLHYVKNNQKLIVKKPVLIDAGARYKNYSADITRTLMVGKPTARQEMMYASVKEVFSACVALLKPGTSLMHIQDCAEEAMADALKKLKLPHDEAAVRKYFPHAIGHGLGIDVHDSLGGMRELREGMVMTIEPGIYVPEEGIGIRYEDDFLITASGYQNLTGAHLKDLWYTKD